MTLHIDEKGKYFTDVISKDEIAVIIQTLTHRIEGLLHIRSGARIKDELDQPDRFLAVTEASVYSPSGDLLYQTRFMAVNRGQVIWVIPEDERSGGGEA